MVIKNFDQIATSTLRRQALLIAEAGLEAINTQRVMSEVLSYEAKKQILRVEGQKFELKNFERVMCIGFGKAALEAVTEIQKILVDKIACGFVIDLKEGELGNIACRVGTHPYPTKVNIQATKELLAMLEGCSEKDLILTVVSGGGSSLLCYPHDMSCETEVAIMSALTVKGASIQELNTVRKHISQVKGGNLAKFMYPATVISLIFSDVPGDDLSMVASGPTVKDNTTNKDAAAILDKYQILEMCQMPSCKLVETPKEEKYFKNVHNILVVSSKKLLSALAEKAEDLGFKVRIFSTAYQGEARVLGLKIIAEVKGHECLLGAGESTVTIIGKGKGGRNQEMALSALPSLGDNQVLACIASDGHDNTETAGAIIDGSSQNRAQSLKLDSAAYLNNNDSFNFFDKLGDHIQTGLTGANVSDFFVCIKK